MINIIDVGEWDSLDDTKDAVHFIIQGNDIYKRFWFTCCCRGIFLFDDTEELYATF